MAASSLKCWEGLEGAIMHQNTRGHPVKICRKRLVCSIHQLWIHNYFSCDGARSHCPEG